MMRRGRLLNDGLWRCLCPAFDQTSLSKACQQRRRWGDFAVSEVKKRWEVLPPIGLTFPKTRGGSAVEPPQDQPPRERPPREQPLLSMAQPDEETLANSSVADIMAALRMLRDAKRWKPNGQTVDQHQRIIQLVQHLLTVRQQPVSLFIYECMADAMTDPQGSVDGIRQLLVDMAENEMKPTATFCRIALQALMNHPDYVMRQEILEIMQQHWFPIDTPVKQSVVVGLLRDEQYEMAYSKLVEMVKKGEQVDTWVYDIFIMVFGKLRFLGEMLEFLYRRNGTRAEDDTMVDNLIYYALDVCSHSCHHEGTVFGWNAIIRNGRLQPPDGMVESVLATAARHGDAQLATEALDLLSSRGKPQMHHYEAVVEAFAESGDLAAAFRTLGIMRENKIRISRARTRAVHKAMRERPELIKSAEAALREMAREKAVPYALVGAILEALVEKEGTEGAMELYRDVPQLCGGELPTPGMIQDLIINGGDAQTTNSLLAEYAARIPEQDDPARSAGTYGRLITACVGAEDLDLAFRFTRQAMAGHLSSTSAGSTQWITNLVEKCVEREDGRIWPIVDELSQAGDANLTERVQKLLQKQRISKLATEWRVKTGRRGIT